MGATAGAIAAGDLSRRVEPADDRHGGRPARHLAQRDARPRSRRRSTSAAPRRSACGGSSATPRTSCGRRSRRSGATRSCSAAAPTRAPEDLARSMARIEAEAERMGVLVDDLLLLARLDQGRPLEREPVDLAPIVARRGRCRPCDRPRPRRSSSTCQRMPRSSPATRDACARSSTTCSRTRACTRRPEQRRTSRVGRDDGAAVLTIADDGPGMDAEVAASVRALLPGRSGACTRDRRRGFGLVDRRSDRRRPRWDRPGARDDGGHHDRGPGPRRRTRRRRSAPPPP